MRPETAYDRRQHIYGKLRDRQQRVEARLSNYRLLTISAGIVGSIFLYRTAGPALGLGTGALALILFAYLALRHGKVRRQRTYAEALHTINRKGADRLAGRWVSFADAGAEFRDDDHAYASDLDLFGQASLFQWINSAQTPLGRRALARVLTEPAGQPQEVLARQEAVTELAQKLGWRQRGEAEGLLARDRFAPPEPLVEWATDFSQTYLPPAARVGVRVLPAVTVVAGVLYLFFQVLPWQVPALLLAVQTLLLRFRLKERSRVLSMVYRHEAGLRVYARMLSLFEQQAFAAPWLKARQEKLRDAAGRPAFQQVQRLSRIAERISDRENAMFVALNILLLWDYQCIIALGIWKAESGRRLSTWLEVLAEIEALSSLANIRFDHPDWAVPSVVDQSDPAGGVSAQNLGHPLITRNRVCNDFEIRAPAGIAVLTGSNMSGKSTFLRTVGINLVLAYAGAPVCAAQFRSSLMRLWTSMRNTDNLERSTSSFYAEILRIKRIVEDARSKKPVFFLIDEVFKGTNSRDRHQGARALITQLQADGALGLISTHDLELGSLEQESQGWIVNYHFREYYQDQALQFDYILRRGVSSTRNALYLIRLMGIRVSEDG